MDDQLYPWTVLYNFEIRYKEGPTNNVPDLLSQHIAAIDVLELLSQEIALKQYQDPALQDLS